MDKFKINWQNIAQVGLQLKFAFRTRLLVVKGKREQFFAILCGSFL